jgi:hypothetical protein
MIFYGYVIACYILMSGCLLEVFADHTYTSMKKICLYIFLLAPITLPLIILIMMLVYYDKEGLL